ncbi:MAG: transporter [Clostridiales bacterium]|nr:transporter [Clostridiales bacterium]
MKARYIFALHLLLLLFSAASVVSKLASSEPFMSFRFIMLYGIMILLLGIYAVFWQKVLKKLPLIFAYANKAVTLLWGLLFGVIFWHEQITVSKIAGLLLVASGIILFSREVTPENE